MLRARPEQQAKARSNKNNCWGKLREKLSKKNFLLWGDAFLCRRRKSQYITEKNCQGNHEQSKGKYANSCMTSEFTQKRNTLPALARKLSVKTRGKITRTGKQVEFFVFYLNVAPQLRWRNLSFCMLVAR